MKGHLGPRRLLGACARPAHPPAQPRPVPFSERFGQGTRGKQKPTSGDIRKLPPSEPVGPAHNLSSQRRLHPPGGRRFSLAWSLCASRLSSHPRATERPGPANASRAPSCLRSLRHWPAGDHHGRDAGEDARLRLRARNLQGCSRQTMRDSLSRPRARPGRQPARHREALP